MVRGLDDTSGVVRCGASRALVALATHHTSPALVALATHAPSPLLPREKHEKAGWSRPRGERRGAWHTVVVGEVLARLSRQHPYPGCTVMDAGACLLGGGGGDEVVWMDASARGLGIAGALQVLSAIFRNGRLQLLSSVASCKVSSVAGGGGARLEKEAVEGMMRGLGDKDRSRALSRSPRLSHQLIPFRALILNYLRTHTGFSPHPHTKFEISVVSG